MSRFGPGAGQALQRRMLQRKAKRGNSDGTVQDAANAGTIGPGAALPHREQIQKSFGRFDVSQIESHTDEPAKQAALSLGAEAFASGSHVAFGEAPSLHTAAHEAAHVLQQRAGVSLKGGVGEEGDAHERHADAVADKVVRGESAESLLAQATGGATSVSKKEGVAVQLLRSKATHDAVDIGGLPLVRVFDLLRRKDPDPDPGGYQFEDGDRDLLKARAMSFLPAAFQQLIDAQASGADVAVMKSRNVKIAPADQQQLIRFMQQMAGEGVVTGLDQWMAYVSAHGGDSQEHAESRQDHMNELWEAARQIVAGARHVDLSESEIAGTAQTADLKIGDTQIEVKTVREPIRSAADLTGQLSAGLTKFAGAPDGKYEVSIYGSIDEALFGAGQAKGGKAPSKTVADPKALNITTSRMRADTGAVVKTEVKSLIDELVAYLNGAPAGAAKVGKVSIIMENAGSYQATKGPDGRWVGGAA